VRGRELITPSYSIREQTGRVYAIITYDNRITGEFDIMYSKHSLHIWR